MSKKEIRKIDLKEIKNPEFLRDLSYDELELLSSDIRTYLLDVMSRNGGHVSSNLGVVESTISLCKNFDFLKDKIIFDVGHQSYTYKLLTGRNLETLRQKDGISGFQKVNESPYDHFECGHSSTSISVANGMAIARDLNNEDYNVIAYIGDASVVNGLAFEALNNASGHKHKIIIVLNDNDMAISKSRGAVARLFRRASTSHFYTRSKSILRKISPRFFVSFLSKIKNFFKRHLLITTGFDILGYKTIGPIDGHDIKTLDKAFKKAKALEDSVVVHIKTIKGKGFKYAENDKTGDWHGVDKFDIETGEIKKCSTMSWSEYVGNEVVEFMGENEQTVLITPAMINGSYLGQAFEKYPDRCVDVGIAEEHATTLSGGLGQLGKHPIVSMYSTFIQRAYDEIIHDVARMNISSTYLVDRSGLVGKDGDTHQGLYDESFLINMPNTIVAMPSSGHQVRFLLNESLKHNCPFFIRYPKEGIKYNDNDLPLMFGKWQVLRDSKKDIAIISVGPLTTDLYNLIKDKNIDVTLVDALFVKPLDDELLKSLLNKKKIIIYDAYSTVNGFIQSVKSRLLDLSYKGEVVSMGVPESFVKQATIQEQREEFKLTIEDVIKNI